MAILSCATTEHVQQVGLGAEGTELGALAAVEDHRSVHLGVSGRTGHGTGFHHGSPNGTGKIPQKMGFFEWETHLFMPVNR